jgi:hypothetical protein
VPQEIQLTQLEPGTFGASVTEGDTTTEHRVLRAGQLRDLLGAVEVDLVTIVLESMRVLLEERTATELPDDIDLLSPPMDDARFDEELARRLT